MQYSNRIYFAAPLFTQSEWRWNAEIGRALRNAGFAVTLPQERAEPMLKGDEPFSSDELFAANLQAIQSSDIIVAILDQADSDSGTCWECGYAYSLGIPILGIRTDIRASGDAGSVNLMLAQSCKKVIHLPNERRADLDWLIDQIARSAYQLQQSPMSHARSDPGNVDE